MEGLHLEATFPGLRGTSYEVTSRKSTRYNCIAWAAGRDSRWWWPDPSPYTFWPEEPREHSLDAFVRVFRTLGYEICASGEHEPGSEKVAIYVDDSGPTHMARQLASGLWSSKCGTREDISHFLEALEGEKYGSVAVIMKRTS